MIVAVADAQKNRAATRSIFCDVVAIFGVLRAPGQELELCYSNFGQ
jgi:hypothetical protein